MEDANELAVSHCDTATGWAAVESLALNQRLQARAQPFGRRDTKTRSAIGSVDAKIIASISRIC